MATASYVPGEIFILLLHPTRVIVINNRKIFVLMFIQILVNNSVSFNGKDTQSVSIFLGFSSIFSTRSD